MEPKFLKEIENKLEDKLCDYLVVCNYNGGTYYRYSSPTSAYGMAEMIQGDIQENWAMSKYQGITDEEEGTTGQNSRSDERD